MVTLSAAFPFLLALIALVAAQCSGGFDNLSPMYTDSPVLVRSGPHGRLYRAGGPETNPPIHLLHTYGTPYEMGYAHGSLLRQEVVETVEGVFAWLEETVHEYSQDLPPDFRAAIEKYGVAGALDLTYALTHKFTPTRFYEEMRGLADGAGLPYMKVVQLHMFPELIKAACSMFGAWGPATANATGGGLVQLRALDWSTDGPFQRQPLVQIYHPRAGDGHAFANVAWTGFVGALTGISSAPVGVCEKVWLGHEGKDSRSGIPWPFLLRDILQYDQDIDQALHRIMDANRTCPIWLGLGDGRSGQFRVVGYSLTQVPVWSDTTFPQYLPAHPNLPGVVYLDKHVQPSHNMCFGSLMQQYYGRLDTANTIRHITSQSKTGDMHIAIYDYRSMHLWVSNAGVYDKATKKAEPAYARSFTRFDLGALFKEPSPQ